MCTQKPGKANTRQEHNKYQQKCFHHEVNFFKQDIAPEVKRRLRKIVDSAKLTDRDSVLDVGTGTGVLLPYIQQHPVIRIVACDLTPEITSVRNIR